MRSLPIALLLLCSVGCFLADAAAQEAVDQDTPAPALPRWRTGGTPFDERQSLEPYTVRAERDIPTSGLLASPPEYAPSRGVLYKYQPGNWTEQVRDCVVALTQSSLYDEIAYVVVNNTSHQTTAYNDFNSHGADMSKVQFIVQISDAIWIRDYGPHFMWQDGALGIVDSHYYPERPQDNFIPTLLGDDHLKMPTYDIGLYYSGGNFQPGPNRMAIMSALVNVDNPASAGFNALLIAELFNKYQGIDTLHIFPQLPTSVDGTGHIDMWMYLVDDHTVIVSQFKAGSNAQAITITNNGATYMQNLGFTVYRTPAWNATQNGYMTNYTYTNAYRVNDRVFVPIYGPGNASYTDEDAEALATWQTAAGPNVTIVPINCYPIIWAAGAIHCIVMQVPRYTEAVPAAHVMYPDGGELLVAGDTCTIQWVATDTDNAVIPQIDLYYTLDDGANWEFIVTTTNLGSYAWTVPNVAAPQAKIMVLATAADADQAIAVSQNPFQIAKAVQSVYDFETGGGTDKFGWGFQTASWTNVENARRPVSSPVSASNYPKLANSDATGGDTDPNRYIATAPASGYESTHVFEFTLGELPATIDDIALRWEGYADNCTQAELYVWDYVQLKWGDAAGTNSYNYGQNRYVDNWAGNRDSLLTGNIQSNFARYVDPTGQMTLLIYGERPADETFHDYVSVTVTRITQSLLGDLNCDGVVTFDDINPFVLAISDQAGYEAEYPDCHWLNGDADDNATVDFDDINPFVDLLAGL